MDFLPPIHVVTFALVGALVMVSALKVVTTSNLVHSVLWLAMTLVSTAFIYVQLQSEFMAGVQLLLYAGGVVTLMIFAVLLTRKLSGDVISHGSAGVTRGAVVSLMVFGLLSAFIIRVPLGSAGTKAAVDSKALGFKFLTEFALPFEVLGVLLVATMIGAVVIARREDA